MKFFVLAVVALLAHSNVSHAVSPPEWWFDVSKEVKWYTPEQLRDNDSDPRARVEPEKMRPKSTPYRGSIADGYVVRQDGAALAHAKYEVMPANVAEALEEYRDINNKISKLRFVANDANAAADEPYLNGKEQKGALAAEKKYLKEIEKLEAQKTAQFGPKADEAAKLLHEKAEKLGAIWLEDSKAYRDYHRHGAAKPRRRAVFTAAEKEVDAAGKKFVGLINVKSLAKGRGKYGLAGAAIGAAVIGAEVMNGGEAKADELKAKDLPAEESEENRSEVGVGVLGE